MAPAARRTALFGSATSAAGPALADIRDYAVRQGFVGSASPPARGSAAAGFASGRYVFEAPGLVIAMTGSPWWSEPDSTGAAPIDPADRIAQDYRRFGDSFVDRIRGSFALALLDLDTDTTILAVDRIGIESLAYSASADTLVFGSRADAVAAAPGRRAALRPQALFDFLLMHMVPSPDTVYEAVFKLRPGTLVRFRAGTLTTRAYWEPVFVESGGPAERELAARLLTTLESAVAACNPGEQSGAFLSGGLDSSTVTGMLSRLRGPNAKTFSIGFGIEGYDELEYARIASRHFGTSAHEYNVTPDDVVTALPQIAAAYDEPFGNSSAVPTYFCARLAREHGVTHLLAGDGGDEIFGGNERYARQKIFEIYGHLPQPLRVAFIEPLARLIPAEIPVMPLRKLRSYVDQARIAMPERLESWNFMYRTDLDAMLDPQLRAAIDTRYALRQMAEVYGRAQARSLVNKMLFFDWHYTLADNDLRKVGTMCDLAGVRVSFPMLDDRLLDLSLLVSPRQKVAGTELRAFYKRTLAGFLPSEIIRKKKHGFGLPFGVWLKTHRPLADLIYSLLTDLKSRRLVRGAFLDQLIEDHRAGHPSYFGYAIWDLAMLEAWLAAHPAGA